MGAQPLGGRLALPSPGTKASSLVTGTWTPRHRISSARPAHRSALRRLRRNWLQHPTLDGAVGHPRYQPRQRRRLHHTLLAGATGVFGPAGDQHPELGGDDVQALGDVLADAVQLA